MLFSSSMRGSIIFASTYIGGGLGVRFVGFSVGSVAASSGSALNGLCSLYLVAIVFFRMYRFSSRLRAGLPSVFCWKLPPSSFLPGVLVCFVPRRIVLFP